MSNPPSPETNEPLRPVLERIAAALEKGSEAASKKDDKEGGDDKGKEGGGDEKGKEGEKGKDGDKKESKAKKFFLSPLGIILTLVVLTVLVLAGIALWHYESTHESTNDAYTTAHVHQVSPQGGRAGDGGLGR